MHDRRRRLTAAILSGTLLATVLIAAPASAVAVVWTNMYYGSSCVSGTGALNALHTIRLLEGTTRLTNTTATSDAYGSFYACFPSSYELIYGYKLEVKTGTYTRTITIPNLSLKTDRISDVVSGKGPANKLVKLSVSAYQPGDYVNYDSLNRLPAVNGSGNWSIDFTGSGGIRGGDSLTLYYKPNQDYAGSTGDTWRLGSSVEYMHVFRGATGVWGTMNVGESATITLKTGAGAVRARAGVGANDYDGDFDGIFRNTSGAAVRPNATDKVSATFATDANVTIPNITVVGNASSDVISGACMPNQGWYVFARKLNYSDSVSRYGTTNGSGAYSTDITADMNLVAGDYISIECKYDSGDEIQREGVAG